MRISIIAIGRLKSGSEDELFNRYFDRAKKAGRQIGFEFAGVREFPESKHPNAEMRQQDEAGKILGALSPEATLYCLDERGEAISSQSFSRMITDLNDNGHRELTFVIGGPDGVSEKVRTRAKRVIAFGKLTYPHMIV